MESQTYSPSQAPAFVAVGQLQKAASRSQHLFYQERYLRAADNILRAVGDAAPDPDLLSLGHFSELEVSLAIEEPNRGESPRIAVLRQAAQTMRRRGVTNVKKTVRRRHEKQRPLDSQLPAKDSMLALQNRLDCETLLADALPKQQDVLKHRLAGCDDDDIARLMGLSRGNVAVLAYRGHRRIREGLVGLRDNDENRADCATD